MVRLSTVALRWHSGETGRTMLSRICSAHAAQSLAEQIEVLEE